MRGIERDGEKKGGRGVGVGGKERFSRLVQGHCGVHVLSRHHLLQEHVSLPERRIVQASAKMCCNTDSTVTSKQTSRSTLTSERTQTHTHWESRYINSYPVSVCGRVQAINTFLFLRVCRYLREGKYFRWERHKEK